MSAAWWPNELRTWWHAQQDPWASCPRGDWLVWWLVGEDEAGVADVASLLLTVLGLSVRHAASVAQLELAAQGERFDSLVGPRGAEFRSGGEDQAAQDALHGLARLAGGDRYGAASYISGAVWRQRVSGDAVRHAWRQLCAPTALAVGGR